MIRAERSGLFGGEGHSSHGQARGYPTVGRFVPPEPARPRVAGTLRRPYAYTDAMRTELEFGPDYCEDVTLGGDLRVRLRLIRASDKDNLQRGLQRLSPQSRYLRFFTAKPRLSAAELSYLTEIDGWSHFAIVAARLTAEGEEGAGAGVARFIRLPEDARIAEPAIVVVDDAQGCGLGGLLMNRLVRAALEREIQAFRSEFLATNTGARELFKSMSEVVSFSADGSVAVAEIPLSRQLPARSGVQAAAAGPEMMDELFRLVASRVLELRRRFAMLLDPDQLLGTLRKLAEDLGIPTGRPDE